MQSEKRESFVHALIAYEERAEGETNSLKALQFMSRDGIR